MPREIIHDPTPVEPDKSEQSTPFAVSVGWQRDHDVQLATINLQKDELSEDKGWFVNLRRQDINRLILVLRRARDQAYGRDE